MKKIILIFILNIGFSAFLTAQTKSEADRYQVSKEAAADRATKKRDKLMQIVGSDATLSVNIYNLYFERLKKTDEIKGSTADNETKDKMLKANKDAFEIKLKGLLTTEQYNKYKAEKEKEKETEKN